MTATLQDLCEPILLFACRMSRAARKGGGATFAEARREAVELLASARSRAAAAPGLLREFERVEEALVYFIDSMMAESELPFAEQWHAERLAYAHNERAGDDKFFDILDEILADSSEEATRAAAVLYSCMGVGFQGSLAGAPEELNAKMLECAGRIRGLMEQDVGARITPEAYTHVDRRDLTEPPGAKLGAIALGFAGVLAVLFLASVVFYRTSISDLRQALEAIVDPESAIEGRGTGS